MSIVPRNLDDFFDECFGRTRTLEVISKKVRQHPLYVNPFYFILTSDNKKDKKTEVTGQNLCEVHW